MAGKRKAETSYWGRGPVVLTVLAVLIVATASTAFIGNWVFDIQRDKRVARDLRQSAAEARDAWIAYADETGRTAEDAARAYQSASEADTAAAWEHAIDAYLAAFEDEQERLVDEWNARVATPWRDELARRFPFDPEVEEDAPKATVERLLNPVDGRVWSISGRIDRLTNIELDGRRVVLPPAGYDAFIKRARTLRDALFPLDTAGIDVPLEVALDAAGAVLEIGRTAVGGEATEVRWDGGGATLTAAGVELDYAGREWGLLRLLGELGPGLDRDGERAWSIDGASVVIRAEPGANPLDTELYRNLHVSPSK